MWVWSSGPQGYQWDLSRWVRVAGRWGHLQVLCLGPVVTISKKQLGNSFPTAFTLLNIRSADTTEGSETRGEPEVSRDPAHKAGPQPDEEGQNPPPERLSARQPCSRHRESHWMSGMG